MVTCYIHLIHYLVLVTNLLWRTSWDEKKWISSSLSSLRTEFSLLLHLSFFGVCSSFTLFIIIIIHLVNERYKKIYLSEFLLQIFFPCKTFLHFIFNNRKEKRFHSLIDITHCSCGSNCPKAGFCLASRPTTEANGAQWSKSYGGWWRSW